jgi:anti-anti-sigma regulatory factor
LIIRPAGYLNDIGGARMREAAIAQDPAGIRVVLFDFSESTHVNSYGISTVLDVADNFLQDEEVRVAFCRLSPLLKEAFRLVGLNQLGPVFSTEEEARAQMPK